MFDFQLLKAMGSETVSRLSIIIPLLSTGAVKAFEGTLASVLGSLPAATEVLVLDGIGYGDPWQIGREGVRFLTFETARMPSEIHAVNEGIKQITAPVVHLLSPGTEVNDGWTEIILPHFNNEMVACVVPTLFDAERKKIFSLGVQYKRTGELHSFKNFKSLGFQSTILAPHVGGAFFRKKHLDLLGGFDASLCSQISLVNAILFLRFFGCETIVETDCRINVHSQSLKPVSPYSWAYQSERLYRRWSGTPGNGTFLEHLCFLQTEFWKRFPTKNAFVSLFGRIGAFWGTQDDREKHRELLSLLQERFSGNNMLPEKSRLGDEDLYDRRVA